MPTSLTHDHIERLKKTHPTLRLLHATHAPLILSFFYAAFIENNRRPVRHSELVNQLEDYLLDLNSDLGNRRYPKEAKVYLEEWSRREQGFLRQYLPKDSDEPEFDLEPAAEKAIKWFHDLEENQFVGTESRLLTLFGLLRDIVNKSETDPRMRIERLEQQKASIELEIQKLREGVIEPVDPTQLKERFFQLEDTARSLLSDFRQVEKNFRDLDQMMRERFALSTQTKGELLTEVFKEHDGIRNTDQGRSFKAFWEFLMSVKHQEELGQLVKKVLSLDAIRSLEPDDFLRFLKRYLLEDGEKVSRTTHRINEQLRRFLDEQVHLENKRIVELTRELEKQALAIRDQPPNNPTFTVLAPAKPEIVLAMSRTLHHPPQKVVIQDKPNVASKASVDLSSLYSQVFMDTRTLQAQIRYALQSEAQVTLLELIQHYPIQHGLAEVMAYLHLATQPHIRAVINDEVWEWVRWETQSGQQKQIQIPQVLFLH